ncbi:MAG: hypothetical protein KC493_13880 [Bacteriovoracaceae bacterium]|nr:hypothetical protein [Bacteriovoracaceae bacterium]
MKLILLIVSIVFSTQSLASIDRDTLNNNYCKRLISFGPNQSTYKTNPPLYYSYNSEDYFIQRVKRNSRTFYEFSTPHGLFELKGEFSTVRDFVITDDRMWIASLSGLLEFNLEGKQLKSWVYPGTTPGRRSEQPRGVFHDRPSGHLLLASAGMGLVAFDLTNRSFTFSDPLNTYNQNGHYSSAIAITGDQNGVLWIAMTGETQKAFNGIVTYDLQTQKMLGAAAYNRRKHGVLFPYGSLYLNSNSIYLNNGGWIHSFTRNDLLTNGTVRPIWKPIERRSNNYRQYIMIKGDFIFHNNEIMGCGTYRPGPSRTVNIIPNVFSVDIN